MLLQVKSKLLERFLKSFQVLCIYITLLALEELAPDVASEPLQPSNQEFNPCHPHLNKEVEFQHKINGHGTTLQSQRTLA